MDNTSVQMLAPGTGRTQTARLWAYVRDEQLWKAKRLISPIDAITAVANGDTPARILDHKITKVCELLPWHHRC